MSTTKIQHTKNYRLFHRHEGENRAPDLRKHKSLADSMKLYGFIPQFAIICYRDKDGKLIVKDGQHRLLLAEELGLPVSWIESDVDFNPAVTSSAGKAWTLRDYALNHAFNGLRQYQEGLDFAEQHKIPLGIAFAMLAGTTTFSNVEDQFKEGTFKIKDREWANAVAGLYGPMVSLSDSLRKSVFLAACMAVCRVPGFDAKRLLGGAERCREKLVSFSTREAYFDLLEELYNFGRKQLVGLKAGAMMAMRERSVAVANKKAKVAKEAA